MPTTILGLDIGGANLKAATPDRQAVSLPFPLWKQQDRLPDALAGLLGRFPPVEELAVTMTGELCDCFETKRVGVHAIIAAVRRASEGRPIRVWSTDGEFLDSEAAKQHPVKVAAANWHALATLAGQYAPHGRAILVDVGSTTTDIIPILDGAPVPEGKTDFDRLQSWELVYTGVRRTPLCALMGWSGTAEFFATTHDAYLVVGQAPEEPENRDTADGRPATRAYARARLCRMYGGDVETIPPERIDRLAEWVREEQLERLRKCERHIRDRLLDMPSHYPMGTHTARLLEEQNAFHREREKHITYIVSGSGEFLAEQVVEDAHEPSSTIRLSDQLDPAVSACAPAYAVAVLAAEPQQPRAENWLSGLWPWSGR
jgi:probable H4MPT-linked C1 transfer pathway protein